MFAILLFFVCVGAAFGNIPNYGRLQHYQNYLEFSCLAAGGICMESSDCPEGKQAPYKGLCLNKGKDAVCCYSVAISETRCQRNGGECMPTSSRCPDTLIVRKATDCASDEKCCVLI